MAIVTLLPGKEKRIATRHPWIFRSDIEKSDPCAPGDTVTVKSHRGAFLCMAVYNPASQIALRVLSFNHIKIDEEFIRSRVRIAVDYRRKFADLRSCRVLFAESDGLPAVIADAFGDVIVMQCLCLGMEKYKSVIADELRSLLSPAAIYERGDAPVRSLEGLPLESGTLYGDVPERVEMIENGIRFLVDVKNGQKTGYFLDQKENRAAIAPFAKGARTLDCFTHVGSFALHAAKFGASEVIGVDISDFACKCAAKNARLNNLDARFVTANAFDLLKEQSLAGEQYDLVILDPPAFAKSRSAVESALRGYKEINLRAMKLARDGGVLVTCSCSQHVSAPAFQDMILQAARDARVGLTQIEFRTQGRDHPILPQAPETQYLKCGLYRVEK